MDTITADAVTELRAAEDDTALRAARQHYEALAAMDRPRSWMTVAVIPPRGRHAK